MKYISHIVLLCSLMAGNLFGAPSTKEQDPFILFQQQLTLELKKHANPLVIVLLDSITTFNQDDLPEIIQKKIVETSKDFATCSPEEQLARSAHMSALIIPYMSFVDDRLIGILQNLQRKKVAILVVSSHMPENADAILHFLKDNNLSFVITAPVDGQIELDDDIFSYLYKDGVLFCSNHRFVPYALTALSKYIIIDEKSTIYISNN